MSAHAGRRAAARGAGLDRPARQRPRPAPHSPSRSRRLQKLAELSQLTQPALVVALAGSGAKLSRQTGKARFHDAQSGAFGVRFERELDQRHRHVTCHRLPAKREAGWWLHDLNDAAIDAFVASRTIPGEDDVAARTQIDAGLRAEPGGQLVRLGKCTPDALARSWEDQLAFDRIGDVNAGAWHFLCNPMVAHDAPDRLPCNCAVAALPRRPKTRRVGSCTTHACPTSHLSTSLNERRCVWPKSS